jgi:methionyl aminopeptidase
MSNHSTILASRSAALRRGRSTGSGVRGARGSAIALRDVEEVKQLRSAGAVVAQALETARRACVVGATTASVDAAASEAIRSAGATPLFLGYPSADGASPFPACTCISVNDEIVHGIPGTRVIRDGDLVSIDCGVRLNGWCSDSAITVPVGRVTEPALRLLDVAESMLQTAIRLAAPGVAWSAIAEAMQDLVLGAGNGVVIEYVGHGIGRELHESPQLPNCLTRSLVEREDFTLRPGMVLAIEPMITLGSAEPTIDEDGFPLGVSTRRLADGWTVVSADGSPAAHVEHTIAVTDRGCEVLSLPALRTSPHR